ncbi:MAG TPA: hypothetical protein DCZ40_13935 [Lachnospiraceae bacterium]|nr:hypothetical protein [Lachnospiraceae bacterium]
MLTRFFVHFKPVRVRANLGLKILNFQFIAFVLSVPRRLYAAGTIFLPFKKDRFILYHGNIVFARDFPYFIANPIYLSK